MAVLHQRTIIRRAIWQRLLNVTVAGARVFSIGALPLRRSELPVLVIDTGNESVSEDSVHTAPRELTRLLTVDVEGWVPAVDNSDVVDDVDALSREIEVAMDADPYLGGAVGELELRGTVTDVVEEGDRLMARATLTYQMTYRTLAPEAPADLDEANSVAATHNLGGDVHQDDVAIDQFNLRENS